MREERSVFAEMNLAAGSEFGAALMSAVGDFPRVTIMVMPSISQSAPVKGEANDDVTC